MPLNGCEQKNLFTETFNIEDSTLYVNSHVRCKGEGEHIWTLATNILCPSINKTYSKGCGGRFINSAQATDWKRWIQHVLPLTIRGTNRTQLFANEEKLAVFKLFVFPSINYDVDNRIKLLHDSFQPDIYRDDLQITIGGEFKVISGYKFDCGLFVCVVPESYAADMFLQMLTIKNSYVPLGKKKKKKLEAMNIRPEYSVKLLNDKIINNLTGYYTKNESANDGEFCNDTQEYR